jgi:PfaD family protein
MSDAVTPRVTEDEPLSYSTQVHKPIYVFHGSTAPAYRLSFARETGPHPDTLIGWVPALRPSDLGAPSFRETHQCAFAYYAGSMANGIASEDFVGALTQHGILAFFGAAGLLPQRIEAAVKRLRMRYPHHPWGCNVINTPGDSGWQEHVVDLLLAHDVRCVEASAYVVPSPALIRYRLHGIHEGDGGKIVVPNRIIAKVSRTEVADRFFAPPADRVVKKLREQGLLTEEQALLAKHIPLADDVTAEADSAGHTDHRPALVLLPVISAVRDRWRKAYDNRITLRVGLAGGIGTPMAAAAAFELGADYIVTGSVNQSCVEAGTSTLVKNMLAEAAYTDVDTAPAADMFEMGVTVQVLKKGTRFALRARKLYDLYKSYETLDALPTEVREQIETEIFRKSLTKVWEETRAFFLERDPSQVAKAETDPRHRMALVFRWYLGLSSAWANAGVEERRDDFQIWCGPAMGAFNDWVRGSFLEATQERRAVTVAWNILYGAAIILRARALQRLGVPVRLPAQGPEPLTLEAAQQQGLFP